MSDTPRSEGLLDAVHRADEAIWDPRGGTTLSARNDAVRAAMAGGWTAAEIARQVKVTPVDVERWSGLASS